MKIINGPKKTTPLDSPQKTIAPRKAPITPTKTIIARKHVARKSTARKSAVKSFGNSLGSYACKHISSKNFASATKTPPRKTISRKDIARKATPSRSGKGIARKAGKSPIKGGKGRKRRVSLEPVSDLSSDDDGYSALEDITDLSDDDDSELEHEEEEHLTEIDGGSYFSTEDDNDHEDNEEDEDMDEDENDLSLIMELNEEFDVMEAAEEQQQPQPQQKVALEDEEEEEEEEDDDDDDDNDDDEEEEEEDSDSDMDSDITLPAFIEKDDNSVDGDVEDDDDKLSSWNGVSEDGEEISVADAVVDTAADIQAADEESKLPTLKVEETPAEISRKVHFDVSDSPSSSTDNEVQGYDDIFPDIFVEQSTLDPNFRREIEEDSDSSQWDFNADPYEATNAVSAVITTSTSTSGSNTAQPTPQDQVVSDMSVPLFELIDLDGLDFEGTSLLDSTNVMGGDVIFDIGIEIPGISEGSVIPGMGSGGSMFPDLGNYNLDLGDANIDGYESDGETTDEDSEPIAPISRQSRPQTPERRASTDLEDTTPARRGQPRAATFDLDRADGKPIVVADPRSRKMMVFTPDKRREHQIEVTSEMFNNNPLDTSLPNVDYFGHFAHAPEIPFQEMTDLDLMNMDFNMGMELEEALAAHAFPGLPSVLETAEEEIDSDELGNIEVENETHLNFGDFVNYEAHESDTDPASLSSNTGNATGHLTMYHVPSKDVGVFRRNQSDMQLINSSRATPDSLALGGSLHTTTLKGLKASRLVAASVPLTPMRQRKNDFTVTSPLESISAKRKAIGEAVGGSAHKRQRSISDVALAEFNA